MSAEPRRGCGYRRVHGLYLVADAGSFHCCKLPIALPPHKCNVCGLDHTIHQTRGLTWLDPKPLLASKSCTEFIQSEPFCPAADPAGLGDEVLLQWVGVAHYETPEKFAFEAQFQGISRRIRSLPNRFKLGETYILLAHSKAIVVPGIDTGITAATLLGIETLKTDHTYVPGIFYIFKPTRVEKIVTASEFMDSAAMDKLREQGLTPVPVPDNDPDHSNGNDSEED